ncbi:MAG: deoxyribodipyrimidine photolyase, partial [Spirochaetales bacterium]
MTTTHDESIAAEQPDAFADRVTDLNDAPIRDGAYVLYWMQQSQRAHFNHALEYAVGIANARSLPVVVAFGVTADYPDANERHFRFMLDGLCETSRDIRERGIGFVLRIGKPVDVVLELGRSAAAIVCDRGYLRHQREWRFEVGRSAVCRVVEVESDLVVPVEVASGKQEYAARTIRPRVQRQLGRFLIPLASEPVRVRFDALSPAGEDPLDVAALMRALSPVRGPGTAERFFQGGPGVARSRFREFAMKIDHYEERRNEPSLDVTSGMSPYLHFGQISSLWMALEVGATDFAAALAGGRGRMS